MSSTAIRVPHAQAHSVAPGAPKTVSVLGSTGSVGTQTIELLTASPRDYRVVALVGGRNATLLAEQARRLGAEHAVISDPGGHAELAAALAGTGITTACGPEAVVAAAALPADWTMAAITGAAGLQSTLAAIRRGASVALANKEALVCAGEVMLAAVREHGATLLPVDSEHNAIFQALADGNRDCVEKIVLTASGGPFRDRHHGGDGPCAARGGIAPSGLVDGRQDQHRQRHDDEQGTGTDRGGAPVRPGER